MAPLRNQIKICLLRGAYYNGNTVGNAAEVLVITNL